MLIETLAAMTMMSGGLSQEAAPYAPGGQERVAPRGDYRDSCSGAYVNRGRLYADCRDRRGNIRGTSIELNRCSDYEIRNDNGLLVCGPHRGTYEGRPGGGGDDEGGWGGGRRNEITVYRDALYRGASTSFRGAMPNLRETDFNDNISSMRFRGTWEVCTDAYFRGTCRTFSDDVWNLQQHGMNDRISSLRPVRGGGRR
ncbi:beta/gamma crystallin-related protein [Brevundimonas sp.]|uniref:beta/gamma crystallin-related protein n=1 Tax=Brevundimonas sp. TaxID=1871086 RepID=UPI002D623E10|nr:beta/gamma crystallin-related protein [Brevundimonas sp.]HYC73762.1 beta/gamma crystallin-related protein [Brevundimonas sp.]